MRASTSTQLTLKDRLSRLTLAQAKKRLGGGKLSSLGKGGHLTVDASSIDWARDELLLEVDGAEVRIYRDEASPDEIGLACSACEATCEHLSGALSFVLEEKLTLGLAAPPPERVPADQLSEAELIERALEERRERARTERMTLRSSNPKRLWTDYTLSSASSGRTYHLALRGREPGQSYCSCPDFRKNTLGTCKHLLYAFERLQRKFSAATFARPYTRPRTAITLAYGATVELRVAPASGLDERAAQLLAPFLNRGIEDLPALLRCVAKLQAAGHEVAVHPDAEEYIERRLVHARLQRVTQAIRADPAQDPLRTGLLRAELLPYQLDGIAFAVGAGRAVLADDMGLGKTIQGIGVAELFAREAGITRVLVVAPASVKSQWAHEVRRFSERSVRVVLGGADERGAQYGSAFFTICNYEQVLRDEDDIRAARFDLVILDEGQRIKNWEAKTSAAIKRIKSPYALVLTGTPLENRLDDLYSVVEFVDERRLAPAFRFYNRHRVVDERGRIMGYRDLADLREQLAPVLLRRTRAQVLDELPPRSTEVIRITPTQEQLALHDWHMQIVKRIVRKSYLTEMDLLRLQKALLMCRMSADSAALCGRDEPEASSKLEALQDLLQSLLAEKDRKLVLFSEWTRMLDRIEPLLTGLGAEFVRLDGSVPQAKRRQLVERFQNDAACRVFLTSNAGATGLNLQAANTVVNIDLPWNPALLEQRIGRAHRMGQRRPVQVFLLVTEGTLEERLLSTLAAKQELFQAVLDPDSDVEEVSLVTGIDELKARLEVLLGAKPDAPQRAEDEARNVERQAARAEEVALAGGRLLEAAFGFLSQLMPAPAGAAVADERTAALASDIGRTLHSGVTRDASGRPTLSLTLPDDEALSRFAATLARLASVGAGATPGG